MNVSEKSQYFITEWGKLGVAWGINKTMAHIHALLLCSCEALCADEIRARLDIGKGSAHQNIKLLKEWKLIIPIHKDGVRKEYFQAEKDMWVIFRQILINRKNKELTPLISLLEKVSTETSECPKDQSFNLMISDMLQVSQKADSALNNFISLDSDEIIGKIFQTVSYK